MPAASKNRPEHQASETGSGGSRLGWQLYFIIAIVAGLIFLAINIPFLTLLYIGPGDASDLVYWGLLIGTPLLIVNIWLFRWLKDNVQVHRWTAERQRRDSIKGNSAS